MGHCNLKGDFAYGRIGLYFVDTKNVRTNFCDVHMYGGQTTFFANVRYTGPTSKRGSAKQSRSKRDGERYQESGDVTDDNDISNGGIGRMRTQRGSRHLDVWLFGPVKLAGRGYASLFAELEGWKNPVATFTVTERDKKGEVENGVWTTEFPVKRHFQPCKLYSSGLLDIDATGKRVAERGLDDKIDYYRKSVFPLEMPPGIRSVVWKFEQGTDLLSFCGAQDQGG